VTDNLQNHETVELISARKITSL